MGLPSPQAAQTRLQPRDRWGLSPQNDSLGRRPEAKAGRGGHGQAPPALFHVDPSTHVDMSKSQLL